MEQEILSQLEKMSPLTMFAVAIAYTIGKTMTGELKESQRKCDALEAKIEHLTRELEKLKDDFDEFKKKKAD